MMKNRFKEMKGKSQIVSVIGFLILILFYSLYIISSHFLSIFQNLESVLLTIDN
ncbi:hypothetical protein RchiOBHm_Chr3g0468641 [Rosa chinensis]|uniref:Uncharacterized protein n=1 Tax=Rosa chinensis TaxID=74649 RepID=A0A2P6RAK4_ROSCH|nr:hypothetical protein RchiOBHm_Chr3g0468641 [Rosa chinensis]